MADVVKVPVNACALNLPKSGSSGAPFVRLGGSELHFRPEQWSRVRLPAPEPEPEKLKQLRELLPVAPFAIGPHQRLVEHETYAICFDCENHVGVHTGRKCFNHHALKCRPCVLLKGT
eukprot:1369917-Amphidinium_carterae.1